MQGSWQLRHACECCLMTWGTQGRAHVSAPSNSAPEPGQHSSARTHCRLCVRWSERQPTQAGWWPGQGGGQAASGPHVRTRVQHNGAGGSPARLQRERHAGRRAPWRRAACAGAGGARPGGVDQGVVKVGCHGTFEPPAAGAALPARKRTLRRVHSACGARLDGSRTATSAALAILDRGP
jgi:hypothetical protein